MTPCAVDEADTAVVRNVWGMKPAEGASYQCVADWTLTAAQFVRNRVVAALAERDARIESLTMLVVDMTAIGGSSAQENRKLREALLRALPWVQNMKQAGNIARLLAPSPAPEPPAFVDRRGAYCRSHPAECNCPKPPAPPPVAPSLSPQQARDAAIVRSLPKLPPEEPWQVCAFCDFEGPLGVDRVCLHCGKPRVVAPSEEPGALGHRFESCRKDCPAACHPEWCHVILHDYFCQELESAHAPTQPLQEPTR